MAVRAACAWASWHLPRLGCLRLPKPRPGLAGLVACPMPHHSPPTPHWRHAQRRHAHPAANPEIVAVEQLLSQLGKGIKYIDPPGMRPMEPSQEELEAFQQRLGHSFANPWLLRLALVHCSAAPETDNALLSWLGDIALGLLVTEQLMASMGTGPVGVRSQAREALVSRQQCVQQARSLGLEKLMIIGRSLQGHVSNNMLAELFEAVVGAVYIDGGLPAVRAVFLRNYAGLLPTEGSDSAAASNDLEASSMGGSAEGGSGDGGMVGGTSGSSGSESSSAADVEGGSSGATNAEGGSSRGDAESAREAEGCTPGALAPEAEPLLQLGSQRQQQSAAQPQDLADIVRLVLKQQSLLDDLQQRVGQLQAAVCRLDPSAPGCESKE